MGTKHTKQKLAWRHRNPENRRLQRQRHYDKTKIVEKKTKRRPTGVPHRPWTQEDISILTDPICVAFAGTDRRLGLFLNRSVHAIQQKRYQLKSEGK